MAMQIAEAEKPFLLYAVVRRKGRKRILVRLSRRLDTVGEF